MQVRRCLDYVKNAVPPVVRKSAISTIFPLNTSTSVITTEATTSCILTIIMILIQLLENKILETWVKVRAELLTYSCIESHKVCHKCGVVGDPFEKIYKNMRERNDMFCMWLDLKGCKSELFKAEIQERKNVALSLTVPHTKKSVEDISKATTHSNKFMVTSGRHNTHDNARKSAEIQAKNRDVKMME